MISYYQVYSQYKVKTICSLITKIYGDNHKAIIQFDDEAFMNQINDSLWTFSQKEFIPHGSDNDDKTENQPIFLTMNRENPIDATIKMIVGKSVQDTKTRSGYDRVLYIACKEDSDEVDYQNILIEQDSNNKVKFECWQQQENGSWKR